MAGALGVLVLIGAVALAPASAAGPLADHRICIDPGHGGNSPPARSIAASVCARPTSRWTSRSRSRCCSSGRRHRADRRAPMTAASASPTATTSATGRAPRCSCGSASNAVPDPGPNGALVLYYNDDEQALAQALYDTIYPAMKFGTRGGLHRVRRDALPGGRAALEPGDGRAGGAGLHLQTRPRRRGCGRRSTMIRPPAASAPAAPIWPVAAGRSAKRSIAACVSTSSAPPRRRAGRPSPPRPSYSERMAAGPPGTPNAAPRTPTPLPRPTATPFPRITPTPRRVLCERGGLPVGHLSSGARQSTHDTPLPRLVHPGKCRSRSTQGGTASPFVATGGAAGAPVGARQSMQGAGDPIGTYEEMPIAIHNAVGLPRPSPRPIRRDGEARARHSHQRPPLRRVCRQFTAAGASDSPRNASPLQNPRAPRR